MLAYDQSPLKEECREAFYRESLSEIKNLTPKSLERIFVSLSEKAQDEFLQSLKGELGPNEWETLVIHLKSYQLAMLGDYTEKGRLIKESLADALYEHLQEEK